MKNRKNCNFVCKSLTNRDFPDKNNCYCFSEQILNKLTRKTVVTGHYGSGKTEFAISLALICQGETLTIDRLKTAIIDLDIVNPYFRSRELRDMLESKGISVHGSTYDFEIGAEIPALGISLRAPLENEDCNVIIDLGGNDAGALVLNQFTKYFIDNETTVLAIVNANRPETSDAQSVIAHITSIENATGLTVSCIVNNTHLLRETTIDDILHGYEICKDVSKTTGKEILCSCFPEGIVNPGELTHITSNLMPLGLFTRPTWLDK